MLDIVPSQNRELETNPIENNETQLITMFNCNPSSPPPQTYHQNEFCYHLLPKFPNKTNPFAKAFILASSVRIEL